MTWPTFLTIYCIAVLAILFFSKKLFFGKWIRLARSVIFVVAVFFISNYIAEDRQYWFFTLTLGPNVLDIPIENMIFTGATTVLVVNLYLGLNYLFLKYGPRK